MLSHLDTHNGTFTITHLSTQTRKTFRVQTVTNTNSGLYGKRILSLLSGPNYVGFAFVAESGVYVWRNFQKTKTGEETKYSKYATFLEHADAFECTGEISVMRESVCRICNRKLTVPASIQSGIGPTCAGRES